MTEFICVLISYNTIYSQRKKLMKLIKINLWPMAIYL